MTQPHVTFTVYTKKFVFSSKVSKGLVISQYYIYSNFE